MFPTNNFAGISGLQELFQPDPPHKDIPNPFILSDKTKMSNLLKEAGFKNIHIENDTLTYHFPSAETYTEFTSEISSHIRNMIKDYDEDQQKQVWDKLTEHIKKYQHPDNTIQIPNEVIFVTGEK